MCSSDLSHHVIGFIVGARILAERGRFPASIGLIKQREETRAFEMFWFRQSRQVAERRVDIDHFHQCARGTSRRIARWSPHDQRCSGCQFKIRLFGPDPLFTQMPAMITPQHDGGVLDRKSTRLNSSHVVISYAAFRS